MPVLFRRVRGRAAGHIVLVNPLNVMSIEPTMWGGSDINFSDTYCVVSRDAPSTVQALLEGRVRLCSTPLCDRDTDGAYVPLCPRCSTGCPPLDEAYERMRDDLVESAV